MRIGDVIFEPVGGDRNQPVRHPTSPTFPHVKGHLSKAGGLASYPPPLDLFCSPCYNIKKDLF